MRIPDPPSTPGYPTHQFGGALVEITESPDPLDVSRMSPDSYELQAPSRTRCHQGSGVAWAFQVPARGSLRSSCAPSECLQPLDGFLVGDHEALIGQFQSRRAIQPDDVVTPLMEVVVGGTVVLLVDVVELGGSVTVVEVGGSCRRRGRWWTAEPSTWSYVVVERRQCRVTRTPRVARRLRFDLASAPFRRSRNRRRSTRCSSWSRRRSAPPSGSGGCTPRRRRRPAPSNR